MRQIAITRIVCPVCGRKIAGLSTDDDDSVQLIRHLSKPRGAGYCAASEKRVVPDVRDGGWKVTDAVL